MAINLGSQQWRIERSMLEQFIQRAYEETEQELQTRRDAAYRQTRTTKQEEGGEG